MEKLKLNIQKFASTNKTTHLELSQYTANDKPTYLVDYNGDMAKIDTAVYGNTTKATQNETNIGTMSNLNTTDKDSLVGAINEVNTQVGTNTSTITSLNTQTSANTGNIGTMANLDTTDKSSLVNAINELDSNTGDLSQLETSNKSDLVSAINEVRSEEEGILLWTNSDTSQSFAGQTLTGLGDLSSYYYIEIIYLYYTGSNEVYVQKLYKNDVTTLEKVYYAGGQFYIRQRNAEFTSSITFTDALLNGSTNNAVIIPYKVIGFTKQY